MTWNTTDRQAVSNISATTSTFVLLGGKYAIEIMATWGGGNVTLQRLANDGSTYITVSTYTANAYETQDLPNGTYKLTVTTATTIYAEIVSIVVVNGGG